MISLFVRYLFLSASPDFVELCGDTSLELLLGFAYNKTNRGSMTNPTLLEKQEETLSNTLTDKSTGLHAQ